MTDLLPDERHDRVRSHVDRVWADDVLPQLHDYIRIPNVSVHFDPDWRAHGHVGSPGTELEFAL